MTGTVHHIGAQPYVLEMCPTCGTLYLFPQAIRDAAFRIRDRQKKENRTITCPEGHQWHYTRKSAEEIELAAPAEVADLKQEIADMKAKLSASDALVRHLGGNVTALPIHSAAATRGA